MPLFRHSLIVISMTPSIPTDLHRHPCSKHHVHADEPRGFSEFSLDERDENADAAAATGAKDVAGSCADPVGTRDVSVSNDVRKT